MDKLNLPNRWQLWHGAAVPRCPQFVRYRRESGPRPDMHQFRQERFRIAGQIILLAIVVLVLVITQASAQMFRLNGVYVANDGSQLLVEAVPVNRGEKLTLILLNRELTVSRADTKNPFVYRHDSCELVIYPTRRGNKYAISIEAFGTCRGDDQVYDGLNTSYEKR